MSKDFAAPDAALAPGSAHAGFTVVAIHAIPELSATAYQFTHDATGARALWIACDDTNRSFAIAFKTPPADDTGVFHILEHSVLCGSARYPVKEPFVHLLKSSMQTFLNALTFPDKTMYPVASTNVADLENLMGVYLDAVLAPNIYTRPHIFKQEGWHYELESADAPLTYNGVVFNEMKGALSDPDDVIMNELNRAMFPNTAYGFESGGNPRAIPTLTYEGFLDNHARHYNLANSYTIFYGDLDIDRELAFVDKRFSEVEKRTSAAANALELQAPVRPADVRVEMATAPENASVALSYIVGTSGERERVLATDILLDALAGSNEAPLKRLVLDAGIADDFSAMLYDGILQPQVIFMLRGAREGAAEKFRALVEEACARFVRDGIDRERLEAALASAEFFLREGDFGSYGDGVALSMNALSSWLYDDSDPVAYLRYEDALASMKAGLENGYFEALLNNLVCTSEHSALVDLVPVAEGDAAEEAAELAAAKAAMDEGELEQIMAEVAELRAEQDAPDTPEDLATLPRLAVADIEDPAHEPEDEDVDAPLPCIAHELDTHKIDYVYHYFDLRCLAFEELPYARALCTLLSKLDTRRRTAAELDTLISSKLGALSFFCETHAHDDDPAYVHPTLVVGASALAEKIEFLASIPCEVWGETLFEDADAIQAILTQQRIALEQDFLNSGHSAALSRVSSYYTRASLVQNQLSGVDYYLFLKDLLKNWSERSNEVLAKLAEVAARIFTADGVIVSFVGAADERDAFWAAGSTLGLAKSEKGFDARLSVPAPVAKNEAFVTPANVVFVGQGSAPSAADTGETGIWNVATRVLSYDYLWNEVRVKGGAYGTGFRRTTSTLRQFWSYRDPGVDATLARYNAAAEWLEHWDPSEDEFAGYVVATVAGHDAPVKPKALARRQDMQRFAARPRDWREQMREQELAATPEKIRALAPALADASANSSVCVFGSREIIEASAAELNIIDLM